jgi:drug/metabolite transporter (DMT)-like permease
MRQEQTPPRLALGISIALVAYIFFVVASSFVWSFRKEFPTIQIIFIQNWICLLSISPLALRKGFSYLKTSHIRTHLIRDIAGVSSYFFYFLAIRHLNLTDATTLNYIAPFLVPFIWWMWVKEKIERNVWWSIIVGFIGVALILNPTKEIFEHGFIYGVLSGVASAIAFVALRLLNLKREPMSRTLFYYFLTGAICTTPIAWMFWVPPNPIQWMKVAIVGLATVTAQMLLTIAYRYGTASHLSPLGYSTVVYAAISSWIFFEKVPTIQSLIGTLLVIVGGTITYLLKKKPESLADTFTIPQPKEKPPL